MIRTHCWSALVKEIKRVNTCFDAAYRSGVQFFIDPAHVTHNVHIIVEGARISRCMMWPLPVCSSTNYLNSRRC